MKSPSSLGLCVLLAASLFTSPFTPAHASAPPDDTGQMVQGQPSSVNATNLALEAQPIVLLPGYTLSATADTSFNPRTDFPTRPVLTAGFGTLNLQECCGGGTWNYADQPADRTLPLLGAVLFAAMLLAAVVHRYDRRRTQLLAN